MSERCKTSQELIDEYLNNGGVITKCPDILTVGVVRKDGRLRFDYKGEPSTPNIGKVASRRFKNKPKKTCPVCDELYTPRTYSVMGVSKDTVYCERCCHADKVKRGRVSACGGWDEYYRLSALSEELLTWAELLETSRHVRAKQLSLRDELKPLKESKMFNRITERLRDIVNPKPYIPTYEEVVPFRSEEDFDF